MKNRHGFTIKNQGHIEYKIFPQPNLEIKDTNISIDKQFSNISFKELKIYTNLKSLYFSEEIYLKKIKFKGKFLGHDINGYYTPIENTNVLFFKVKKLGIASKILLDNKKKLPNPSGVMKLKVLDNNFIINFDHDINLKLKNSVYKNKNLYTNFNGYLNFKPFFYFKIFADIKKVNLENLGLNKIYKFVTNDLSNKKLNGELTVNYLKKTVGKAKTENQKIIIAFNNGDIILKNSIFQFANLSIKINFYLKKYQLNKNLDYNLLVETENINKFFKIIDIKEDKNLKKIKAFISGNVNLDAQKYYFSKIKINKKSIEEKKLIKLKNYLDKNIMNFYNSELNKKNFYLFLKDLIEFI